MKSTEGHSCFGRNHNWRRCGRHVEGKWFCDDHKWQPFILLLFVCLTAVPGVLTIKAYFWPNEKVRIYEIRDSAKFVNRPIDLLAKTFNTIAQTKTDDQTLQVYNPTSGRMEYKKPIEGKIYTTKSQTGGKIDYMVEDRKIYADYTSIDGKLKSYYVSDSQGNLVDQKLPHDLAEYTVVIPPELEIRRSERSMQNGWKSVHVELKWGGKVDMILDPDGKLQSVHIDGGVRINNKLKTFVAGHTDKTTKWMLPEEQGKEGIHK